MKVSATSTRAVDAAILKEMVEYHDKETNQSERGQQPTKNHQSEGTDRTKSTDNFFDDIMDANDIDSEEDEVSDNEIMRECKDELTRYKRKKIAKDTDVDVLAWWRRNQELFPHLAVLARKYLSMQATSAPSERIFSRARQIIDEKRTRLGPEMAGSLLYVAMNYEWYTKDKDKP